MTDLLKAAAGRAPTWVALLTSLLTAAYTAGYQTARVESLERDQVRDERTVRYLELRVRRLEREARRSTQIDQR